LTAQKQELLTLEPDQKSGSYLVTAVEQVARPCPRTKTDGITILPMACDSNGMSTASRVLLLPNAAYYDEGMRRYHPAVGCAKSPLRAQQSFVEEVIAQNSNGFSVLENHSDPRESVRWIDSQRHRTAIDVDHLFL